MSRTPSREITMKEIKEWIALNEKGFRVTEIGKMYNRKQQVISNIFKKFGIKTACPKSCKGVEKYRFYKNKYIINVYDLNEQLCFQFNNTHEMAKTFNKKVLSCNEMLRKSNINRTHRLGNQRYKFFLIEIDKGENYK